jgi:hypothetical protein
MISEWGLRDWILSIHKTLTWIRSDDFNLIRQFDFQWISYSRWTFEFVRLETVLMKLNWIRFGERWKQSFLIIICQSVWTQTIHEIWSKFADWEIESWRFIKHWHAYVLNISNYFLNLIWNWICFSILTFEFVWLESVLMNFKWIRFSQRWEQQSYFSFVSLNSNHTWSMISDWELRDWILSIHKTLTWALTWIRSDDFNTSSISFAIEYAIQDWHLNLSDLKQFWWNSIESGLVKDDNNHSWLSFVSQFELKPSVKHEYVPMISI